MKTKVIIMLVLMLILSIGASAQNTIALLGPTWNNGLAIEGGFATPLGNDKYMAVLAQVGNNKAEAHIEVVKLYKVSGSFMIGPVLQMGADGTDKPGPSGSSDATYVTTAAGLAGTVNIYKSLGGWGYIKVRDVIGNNNYNGKATGGFGLSIRIPLNL